MNAFSNYAETEIVNHLLRATSHSSAATLYVGLFTASPGEAGDANELTIASNGYARVALTNNTTNFPPCALTGEPTKTNGTVITFPKCTPAAWGAVTHWGIFTASSGTSNFLVGGTLSTTRTVSVNDTPKIAVGEMTITITNAAGGGMTNYSKRAILDLLFGKVTFTTPTKVYTGFGTALSGESITEWTDGGSATRIDTAFTAPTDGVTPNTAEIENNANVITEATLTHFGIWDLALAGNLLVVGPLTSPILAETGNSVGFAAGGITFTLQ